jgi:hypothetical protein
MPSGYDPSFAHNKTILYSFNSPSLTLQINSIFIALLPQIRGATGPKQFVWFHVVFHNPHSQAIRQQQHQLAGIFPRLLDLKLDDLLAPWLDYDG